MKLEKTVCPYCGAGLKIEYGQRTVECQYCKSSVLIQDDGVNIVEDNIDYEPYPPDTERNRKGTDPASERRFNDLFPAPGFRTKNLLHIIVAVTGFLLMIVASREVDTIQDAVFFTVISLFAFSVFACWTGFFSGFPGANSRNTLKRILMKLVWSLIFSLACTLACTLFFVSIEMIHSM